MADEDGTQILDGSSALRLSCVLEFACTHACRELRQHLLFDVSTLPSVGADFSLAADASSNGAHRRSPVNLCLCLDRSGSMEGDPLDYAKRACLHVVDMLGPNDVLSVVTFAEQAEVLLPAQRGVNKEAIRQKVDRISIGNRTNLHKGLESALDQVFAGKSPESLNRIVLLSDGEPTVGVKDFQGIVTLVTDRRRDGIKVSGLGFGPAYNEELIAALARRSGGNYYYISRPESLPEIFAIELEGLMRTAARDVKLRVRMPAGIALHQVYANEPVEVGCREYEVGLVDIEWGESVTSLWELDIADHVPGFFRIAAAELEYQDCSTFSGQRVSAEAVVEFSDHPARNCRPGNPGVQSEVRLMLASRQLDQTMVAMRSRSVTAKNALADLERTHKLLANDGRRVQAGHVQRAIDDIKAGESIEKTLIGAIVPIDQGRRA